jgi:hypothetical protein
LAVWVVADFADVAGGVLCEGISLLRIAGDDQTASPAPAVCCRRHWRPVKGKDLLFRFAAFNFLNHANTTYSTAANPNNITLNFSNEQNNNPTASAVPVNAALAAATNSNAAVFGYAPLRIGRRVSEVEIKFTF